MSPVIGFGDALARTIAGERLAAGEIEQLFGGVLEGSVEDAVLGGFLVALAQRGETSDEVAGVARALRRSMRPFEHDAENAIDTCGTGGDGLGTFNVSTAAAFVAAGAGAKVVKHGNRSVSSRSGSADLLEALGGALDVDDDVARKALDRTGFTFLFAPLYHPAMRHAGPVRRSLGVRTVFNLVGPLANPGGVSRQVLGVPRTEFVEIVAGALEGLGADAAYVVHGSGEADELTLAGENVVRCVGRAPEGRFDASALGLETAPVDALDGGDARDNVKILARVLDGEIGPMRDAVALNAAAALVVAGLAEGAGGGLALARESIDSGRAKSVAEDWVRITKEGAR